MMKTGGVGCCSKSFCQSLKSSLHNPASCAIGVCAHFNTASGFGCALLPPRSALLSREWLPFIGTFLNQPIAMVSLVVHHEDVLLPADFASQHTRHRGRVAFRSSLHNCCARTANLISLLRLEHVPIRDNDK